MNLTKNKKISTSQKIANMTLLFIAAMFLIFYFLILPTIKKIKTLKVETITEKINIEKSKFDITSSKNQESEIEKIEPEIKKLNQIYINKNRELEFITTLEGIASQSSVDQKINILFDKEKKDTETSEIPLNIYINGKFNNIINYLEKLNTLNYQINIDNISITKQAELENIPSLNNSNNLSVQISATTYWK